jgi:hypothetical protein
VSHVLSMSKMDLALGAVEEPVSGCLYGYRSDVPRFERAPGEKAQIGTVVHALADQHVKGISGPFEADPKAYAEAVELFNGPLRSWLDGRPWTASELGMRYDAERDEARVGPKRGEPGYRDLPPMVLPGTLDLVRVFGDEAWVPDLKTGSTSHAHVEQLYAQAVAVSRLYGVGTVHVGFAFVRKRKSPEPKWETLDADRLDEEAGRIRRVLRHLPVSQPQPGDWCWRCDARPACPAQSPGAEFDMERADVA